MCLTLMVSDSNKGCSKKAAIENGKPDEKDESNIKLEDDDCDENDDRSVAEDREIKIEQEYPEIAESLKEKHKEDTRNCENNTDVENHVDEDNENNYIEEENHGENNEIHNNEDDEGWITPDNIASLKIESNDFNTEKVGRVPVACLTTDFAMQVDIPDSRTYWHHL